MTYTNGLDLVAQLVEHWTIAKSKVAGSFPTVVKPFFTLPGVDTHRVTCMSKKVLTFVYRRFDQHMFSEVQH